jgi:hypothetical protein
MKAITILSLAVLFGCAVREHWGSWLMFAFIPLTLYLGFRGLIELVKFINFTEDSW